MTTTDLVRAVQQGAHTVPQLAAELHVMQWDADLREQLHAAVLRQELVAVGQGVYDVPGGAQ
ncbi:hypothetical protein [Dactylosporangium salmoneum]|uniref:Uncharacterized protein n=1 Tax=Dactylosporangium salmoneum TaxID=53361 RepID=A0ABN3G9Q0_9ACTN